VKGTDRWLEGLVEREARRDGTQRRVRGTVGLPVMHEYPSGEQWVIAHGGHEVTVVEVGGGLRAYRAGGVEILAGYGVDEQCRAGRGQVLLPWPNRLRDGRYVFDGKEYQLPLTEPTRGHASHGLVRWSPWSVVEQAPDEITVGYRLHPQPGWPGTLDVTVTYALSDAGLTVLTTATNIGDERVPFGCGAHPYIAIGDTPLGDVVLTVPAGEQVLVDDRLIPTGTAPVSEGGKDFREPRALGESTLDTAFTGVERGADGRWVAHVGGLPGRPEVSLWADSAYEWLQVFTGQGADQGAEGTRGIAIEPMTCPADAFNSGAGLIVLEPGDQWSGTWGLTVHE